MTFGDSDGEIFIDFAKSLDVVAHELGHGVTQWKADLNCEGQSGPLNEHFSDIFGYKVYNDLITSELMPEAFFMSSAQQDKDIRLLCTIRSWNIKSGSTKVEK